MSARWRALLSSGDDADSLYRESLQRPARTRLATHHARAQLLYGEWLRRENRRADAREHLRAPYVFFDRIGADGFADRARRELLATGERVRKRAVETRDELTSQEAQIARLAGDGLTNPEIGETALPQPRHGRVAPAQGFHEAQHQLTQTAPRGAAPRRPGGLGATRAATSGFDGRDGSR